MYTDTSWDWEALIMFFFYFRTESRQLYSYAIKHYNALFFKYEDVMSLFMCVFEVLKYVLQCIVSLLCIRPDN